MRPKLSPLPMADARTNGHHDRAQDERFAEVFDRWLDVQDGDLRTLRSAAAGSRGASEEDEQLNLRPLVDRVVSHYEQYYRDKAAAARRDVLPMFSPTWTSTTENLFLWAGGWRPTAAVQLLYSESGRHLQSSLHGLAGGGALPAGPPGLTAEQVERIVRLHRRTLRLEEDISKEEAAAQEEVANAEMVEICHAMTEGGGRGGCAEFEAAMEKRKARMEGVLRSADQLRLESLKAVVEVLRPTQAILFLIAAAELHLTVHKFGARKDAAPTAAESAAPPANGSHQDQF